MKTSVLPAPQPAAGRERSARATPGRWSMAIRAFMFWLVNYRRTWKGTIYTSVLSPLLYLGAMGLGLGTLVDKHGLACSRRPPWRPPWASQCIRCWRRSSG